MLLLEHLDHLAEASAKAISNIKFDKVVVWDNGNNHGETGNVANFLQGMSRTLPPMLQVMKDIGGIELPETFIKMTGEQNGKPETPAHLVATPESTQEESSPTPVDIGTKRNKPRE